jgi:hypothetical protein
MYPRGPEWWNHAWESWRTWLGRRRWALYTCFVIGVVAEKRRTESGIRGAA